ncbi:hypothetical protein [Streptomyces sediminimaris]|uniref:hypothetical protein n=1 Tax=Streptomyces sediminimaris TaxID=3383721 RepID=UPI0039999940
MNTRCRASGAFWDPGRGKYATICSAVDDNGHNVIMVNCTTGFLSASAPKRSSTAATT